MTSEAQRTENTAQRDPATADPSWELPLRMGDDALIAAQRLAEWCSRAPELEEDIALANIALDQLGAARLFLSYAAELMTAADQRPGYAGGLPLSEDTLAFLRDDRDFRNCLLVELDNGDFAMTIAKLLFLANYQLLRYDRLARSGDERLAAIGAKLRKESAYHVDHGALWTVRLGDGTAESHGRMQAAIDAVWPYTHELFADGPADLREPWLSTVDKVLAEATLTRPADGWAPSGGRHGIHTEALSRLLAEMQVVHRAHPGARW